MESKSEILERALTFFQKNGVKDHSERKITEQLELPEDTFPAIFRDKEDLLRQAVEHNLNSFVIFPRHVLDAARNPIEEIILMFKCCADFVKDVHPGYFIQIQYLYPSIWNTYLHHSQITYYYQFYDLINEGILQDLFRKDINIEIVTKILIEQLNVMHNAHLFPKHRYNMAEVFRSIFLYYLKGICTEKGGHIAEVFFANNSI